MGELLRALQDLLEALYGVSVCVDVRDFLVTDPGTVQSLEGDGGRVVDEKLLVYQSGDELALALYLDAGLLERLAESDPTRRLSAANFADFCTVIEGISHFNYVAWSAASDRAVTLLELEMQAEVDKYVSARTLVASQPRSSRVDVFDRLFGELRYHADLSAEELDRYRDASRFAGSYCRSLESRFDAVGLARGMVRELRAFYRLPQPAKLSLIRSQAFA